MDNLQAFLSPDKKILTIKIQGRFDFKLQKPFRQAYEGLSESPSEYLIDFQHVNYIDSSGLGMLMVFHQHIHSAHTAIRIINTPPEVRELLLLANLSQLFDIR